ncbi:MAG: hypothetical protein QM765_32330 [Myxococcales bacterium]
MRQPLELTGAQLRKAFEANLEAPGNLPTIAEAIGLPLEDCAAVLKALGYLAGKLDQVDKVQVFDPNDPEGDGIYFEGYDFLVEWAEKKERRRKGVELVKVVRKGERAAQPAREPKPALPSSPPKRDLPAGRGLFSSAGKRDSPKPGVLPVPLTERTLVPGFEPIAERFVPAPAEHQTQPTEAAQEPLAEASEAALPPIQDLGGEQPEATATEPESMPAQQTPAEDRRQRFAREGGQRPAFQRREGSGSEMPRERRGFGGRSFEDKPRFQGKPRPEGDQRRDDRRPFGDKPRFQGDRPRFQGKPGERGGDRRPFGDKPRFQSDRPRFQGKPGEGGGDRRPFGDKPRFQGDRPRFQGKPGEGGGDRRPFGDKPRFQSDRPRFQGKPGERSGDRRPFGDKPRFQGDRPRFQGKPGEGGGDRRPFGDKPRFQGDRPRFQGKPGERGADRRPFGDKPRFQGDRPRFQGKPGERRPFGDRPKFNSGERREFPLSAKPERGSGGEARPWKKPGDRPRFESGKPFKKFGKPGGGRFGKPGGGPRGGKR